MNEHNCSKEKEILLTLLRQEISSLSKQDIEKVKNFVLALKAQHTQEPS